MTPDRPVRPAASMDLLGAYDAQVRTSLARRPPAGVVCDWDGPLLRCVGLHRGFVSYRSLVGVADSTP